MLNRRTFLTGCCAAHAFIWSSEPEAQTTPPATTRAEFLCKTIPPTNQDELRAVPYANDSDRLETQTKVADLRITEYGTSFLKDRWLPRDGRTPSGLITLGVAFLGGTRAQQDLIRTAGLAWLNSELSRRIALQFNVAPEESQIRVHFDPNDGNWSYVGRNSLSRAAGYPTMNISNDVYHVCLHEWGHAFGLQHEHQFPGGLEWNETAVIADTRTLWGWSEQQTRQNILSRLGRNAVCVGDRSFNEQSIMLYPVRPGWTRTGFSSGDILELSRRDIDCLRAMYNA